MHNYLFGQRVIVNEREIGVVVKPEMNHDRGEGVWVELSGNKYASCYAEHNVKPLPNGQL